MGNPIRRSIRSCWREFLFGALLGFLSGLLRPGRKVSRRPVAPPAPRPIEVPILAADGEPVWLPISFPAASGDRQRLRMTPAEPTARIGGTASP
jgi:hypothetical protein